LFIYPYPEEKGNLERILKQNELNQPKNNSGPMKPKVIIRGLHSSGFMIMISTVHLLSEAHYYMLQFSTNKEQKLQFNSTFHIFANHRHQL